MPDPTSVFRGDLDNLLSFRDSYTLYQASFPLELAQDTATCLQMSSTPNRAQRSTRSYWDPYPPSASTPRALITPSTSSFSMANIQMVLSPSPLPVSEVPSLVFPEISPPSQGSGSTPFERQFVGDFSREWNNISSQISPVARRDSLASFVFSPTVSNTGGTLSRIDYSFHSPDSQDAVERISLIDKFMSAAADESAITENGIPFSTSSSQDCSSTFSDLSDLTPLSSPESSDRFGRGLTLRSSSPPTSPTKESHKGLSQSPNIHCTPDSGPAHPPSQSRSSPRFCDSDHQPAKCTTGRKRKRVSRSRDGNEIPTKRKKIESAGSPEQISTDVNPSLETLTRRRLPTDIPYHPQFPLFYLRFPVSSYLRLADGTFPLLSADSKRMAGIHNEPRDALDLYTPRFVKGTGATKVGVCPICIEKPRRGGKNETVWLSMKFSAYKWHVSDNASTPPTHIAPLTELYLLVGHASEQVICPSYHLQYAHGISSVSACPFSPPVAFRTIERPNPAKNERTSIQEGKCHKCKKWVLVESIKNIDIKVKELYWWKHAAACHQGNNMEGDDDFFLDDEIYRRATQSSAGDP